MKHYFKRKNQYETNKSFCYASQTNCFHYEKSPVEIQPGILLNIAHEFLGR
jgi:hypothetical protein